MYRSYGRWKISIRKSGKGGDIRSHKIFKNMEFINKSRVIKYSLLKRFNFSNLLCLIFRNRLNRHDNFYYSIRKIQFKSPFILFFQNREIHFFFLLIFERIKKYDLRKKRKKEISYSCLCGLQLTIK